MNTNTPPRVKITPEMMKSFKSVTCNCGSLLFETAILFKKISPLVSKSGMEELYPHEIFVCKKCGKVPEEFNDGIIPDELIGKNIVSTGFIKK